MGRLSMKDAGALLLALPREDGEEKRGRDYEDGDAKGLAKDGARLLLEAVRDEDTEGIVDAFRVLSRACAVLGDEDEAADDSDPLAGEG